MKYMIATLVLSLQIHAWAATDCGSEGHYPIVSKAELQKMVDDKNAVVIDVNGADSYKKSHIPGALDYTQIEKTFATSLPSDKGATIVAYCGGPECDAWKKAAEKACNMGYTNIKHFKAGISGWNKKS